MRNRVRFVALALASFVLSLGSFTKIFGKKKLRTIFIGFLIGLYLTVGWIPAIASVPTAFTRVDTADETPPKRLIADVCLPFVGCVQQRIRQEVNSAFKNELRKLLADELPIRASDQKLLQAVPHNKLPGGEFQGRPLPLANFDPNFVIPPGDYIIKAHFYCTKVYTFNGRGNRFPLAQLQGKAAEALSTIYARASFDGGVSTDDLQRLSWNTQAGLSWSELSDTDRKIIQKYAPEYQKVYSKGLPERIGATVNSLSHLTGGKTPSLDTILNELGDFGKLVNTFLRARQEILSTNNGNRARLDVQQLAPLFAPEKDANLSGGVEVTPWSQISEQVYARFLSPQGAMRDGEIQIRVLADDTSTKSKNENKANTKKPCVNPVAGIQAGLLAQQITSTVGISEANGHQGISTSLAREPVSGKDAQNSVLKQQAQALFSNALNLYSKGEYLNAGRAFASSIDVMSQDPEGAAILSQNLDVMPGIGDLKGLLEAVYGYDLLTNEKLSWFDRAVTALPFDKQIGVLWNSIKKSQIVRRGGEIFCRDGGDTSTPPSGNKPPNNRTGRNSNQKPPNPPLTRTSRIQLPAGSYTSRNDLLNLRSPAGKREANMLNQEAIRQGNAAPWKSGEEVYEVILPPGTKLPRSWGGDAKEISGWYSVGDDINGQIVNDVRGSLAIKDEWSTMEHLSIGTTNKPVRALIGPAGKQGENLPGGGMQIQLLEDAEKSMSFEQLY